MDSRGARMWVGDSSTTRNFIVCTVQLSLRLIKSRRVRWAGHVARMEEGKSAFKILIVKPTGKIRLGKPWSSWGGGFKWILNK